MEICHWNKYSSLWDIVGGPLRPGDEDIEIYKKEISGKALLLGVTPEIRSLNVMGVCIDNSLHMIENVQSDNKDMPAICADWTNMPFKNDSFDTIVGDGALNVLSYLDDHVSVMKELSRVIVPGGKVLLRTFIRSSSPWTIKKIKALLNAGRIKSFDQLKFMIATSEELSSFENIPVSKILDLFNENFDRKYLMEKTGWPEEKLKTIDVYHNSTSSLSFPKINDITRLTKDFFNKADSRHYGVSYHGREFCYTEVFYAQ